jgi:hypothetical protein
MDFREYLFHALRCIGLRAMRLAPPGGIIDVAIAWEMNASWQEEGGGSCRVV